MTVEFVIFDFDGTLADSLPWLLAVFDQMAECYGFKKLDRSEIDAVRHCNTHQVMSHYGIAAWKLPFILWHLRLLMRQDSHSIKPVPGIEAALRSLAGRGIVLGILSSNTRENIRRVLGRETAALFRYWECGSSLFGKTARLRKLLR
jgi:phosphoglycolate phosphatase